MAARTTPSAIRKASRMDSTIGAKGATTASFIGDTVNRPDRAPAFAAGTLPVMRLGAETAVAAAIHGLPFQQLAGEVAQDQEIFPGLAFDLVHGGIDQGHQAAHRW